MNNKGFTLVELLATIAILGILSTITIVTVNSYYEKSRENAVSAFEKNITDYVESYISMYGSKLTYNNYDTVNKCYILTDTEKCDVVSLKKSIIEFKELERKDIVSGNLVNPSTNVKCEDGNITIYRDSDYVYCFVMEENSCSNKINTCKNKYKKNGAYIFND